VGLGGHHSVSTLDFDRWYPDSSRGGYRRLKRHAVVLLYFETEKPASVQEDMLR
jgi:hypothetical protein